MTPRALMRDAGILGSSEALLELVREIIALAPYPGDVELRGETGAGKGLVARAIHLAGRRPGGPFVSINGATLQPERVADELFGHVRGAFTGADRAKAGAFRTADGGTLFLDEVGELQLDVQTQLLAVLEDREVRPLGAEKSEPVDLRVVVATNQDLDAMVEAGAFRPDLRHRFVFQVDIPPLRDRPEDVEPLARAFLAELDPEAVLGRGALRALETGAWPGNVRELRNEVTRALARARRADRARILPRDVRLDVPLRVPLHGTTPNAGRPRSARATGDRTEHGVTLHGTPRVPFHVSRLAMLLEHARDGVTLEHAATILDLAPRTARRQLDALVELGFAVRSGTTWRAR